jgi:hypothetical protein
MRGGRLVGVGRQRTGLHAIYVVAEADPSQAVDIIRRKVAGPDLPVEDLGPISGAFLNTLNLASGRFICG